MMFPEFLKEELNSRALNCVYFVILPDIKFQLIPPINEFRGGDFFRMWDEAALREMHCCNSPLEGHSSLFPAWVWARTQKKKKKVNVTVLLFFSQIHCFIYLIYNKYMKSRNLKKNNSAEEC